MGGRGGRAGSDAAVCAMICRRRERWQGDTARNRLSAAQKSLEQSNHGPLWGGGVAKNSSTCRSGCHGAPAKIREITTAASPSAPSRFTSRQNALLRRPALPLTRLCSSPSPTATQASPDFSAARGRHRALRLHGSQHRVTRHQRIRTRPARYAEFPGTRAKPAAAHAPTETAPCKLTCGRWHRGCWGVKVDSILRTQRQPRTPMAMFVCSSFNHLPACRMTPT